MTEPIIRIENLGKRYRITHQGERQRYLALRDILADRAKGAARRLKAMASRMVPGGGEGPSSRRIPDEDFWALRGVSYDVQPGEVLGVIGRNGAGKTTLLKILSRITEPTEGRVRLRGRVASLLEVGTGFHLELTGRENIFLNGAILGMTRSEIRRKFDEIVDFAEVERFLDTPVKRYSSGMYVRLAFAVAAHLEPEILIVDEVLAVGDAQFQKRCLGKMRDVAHSGRTVLFVSHNMTAVSSLCSSAIWLSNGSVIGRGSAKDLVQEYLSSVSASGPEARFSRRNAGQDVRVERVDLLVDGAPASHVCAGQACTLRVHYRQLRGVSQFGFSVSVMLFSEGQELVNLWTNSDPDFAHSLETLPEVGFVDCHIRKWPFRTHSIRVDVFCHTGQATQDWIEEVLMFDSLDGDFHGSGIITNPDQGILFLDCTWSFGSGSSPSVTPVAAGFDARKRVEP